MLFASLLENAKASHGIWCKKKSYYMTTKGSNLSSMGTHCAYRLLKQARCDINCDTKNPPKTPRRTRRCRFTRSPLKGKVWMRVYHDNRYLWLRSCKLATVCMGDFVTHAIISNFIQEQHFAALLTVFRTTNRKRSCTFSSFFPYKKKSLKINQTKRIVFSMAQRGTKTIDPLLY